jgi:hypothetical protein
MSGWEILDSTDNREGWQVLVWCVTLYVQGKVVYAANLTCGQGKAI